MSCNRETRPSFHRPMARRLVDLTNDELALLFEYRAKAVASELKGHVFWDSRFIVYWDKFIRLQDELYEVMLEIQSRYPKAEVKEYMRLLPVLQTREPRT